MYRNVEDFKIVVSQAAACEGKYYQILLERDNTNLSGVLPI